MTYSLHHGDALDVYKNWATPTTIISDGAYGVGGFVGDPKDVNLLPAWYAKHLEAWSAAATPATSLWFWNTEVGWATMHPHLIASGWKYVQLVSWDKGVGHIAGNINGNTIRRLPTVTEVTALYTRPAIFAASGTKVSTQQWLRSEWKRAGLTLKEANVACGVKSAASRKYLTNDHLWYLPPTKMFEAMRTYANEHGKPEGAPYLSVADAGLDSTRPASSWDHLHSIWNHQHGLTNVWSMPSLRSSERIKNIDGKNLHANQKPEELMTRQILMTSNEGDVVWEPFGGLCSASAVALLHNRVPFAAEPNDVFETIARKRLKQADLLARKKK